MELVPNYVLYNIVPYKTDIKGYYINDNGKIFSDNIIQKKYTIINKNLLDYNIRELFVNGEECIFYKDIHDNGIIQYPNGTRDILPNKRIFKRHNITRSILKGLLRLYGGCTIYKHEGYFTIEVYEV